MNKLLSVRKLSYTAKQLLINEVNNQKCFLAPILRNLHITSFNTKEIRDKNTKVRIVSNKYNLIEGETDGIVHNLTQTGLFPDENTPNWIFKGKMLALHTAGIEGFKNTRKGTNVAAQQAAVTFSEAIRNRSIPLVRVRIQGLGAGRMAALKGLQIGGIEIVSITDSTRVSWNPRRPRKPRRI
ncbi:PREDICTED: 28S ribosomal protein S11, mitochondrial-like isoform X2 [Polistes canadensis]|uniref:28S ribosomal protein S11, mitochondrial-like isoform X2 n=1 Tax=Polistes canadensis TaxID=91411 RepID=UPI000718C387|nr:PREDICTED: 28S ribosomal protein S11, mitochondrial-like isoform X2 [Polistes canadensis]